MVDLAFLEKFTKGDTSKMKKYISMYLKMAPETFERMQQNIENKEWNMLAVNAHSLKPQADYMGIATLKEVLIKIENKVKGDQVDDMQSLYEKAINIHKESETFLQDFLDNNL